MAQEVTSTKINRYPGLMTLARNAWGPDRAPPRILSFGCSTGDEMVTISKFFPDAEIIGCDVDLEIAKTRDDLPGPVFFSTNEAVAEHGPYDMIFANSVLCYHPSDVAVPTVFSFLDFENLATSLHENLNDRGYLSLYNLSYLFRDLPFAGDYSVVTGNRLLENGFVPKWTADGRKITEEYKRWPFRWQFIIEPNLIYSTDFTDCVYCKSKSLGGTVSGDIPKNRSSKWVEQPPTESKMGAYILAVLRQVTDRLR